MTSPDSDSGTIAMSGFLLAAANMRAAAAAGRFAADPESGRALVTVLQKRLNWAARIRLNLTRLGQEPPLGSSPGANTFKPFFASLATDLNDGINSHWENFMQVIEETIEAVKESMENYQDVDDDQAARLDRLTENTHEK
ncbi:hypothetical protein SAMN04487905_109131 [Actinopolyspora xinjiangensis]|uniref:Uncharacterized protein n=1 Tax=Actinopolyspora xinjiangensis TaxID=405564 RepID=A0A1H0VPJ8_9ACTN|nr:hypothetical protein [Actinopolyspora xinjiangensis]SDP80293.1 hypothetical protein SAMN04487905_109131 [Actinopolyspora xinjiangensis]